jgi:hypothetical protein
MGMNLNSVRESLVYAKRTFNYAKAHTPNFGVDLYNSLLGISGVFEAIPVSLIDFETYFALNLDINRLVNHLSEQKLEREAKLAEEISTRFTHNYISSHP